MDTSGTCINDDSGFIDTSLPSDDSLFPPGFISESEIAALIASDLGLDDDPIFGSDDFPNLENHGRSEPTINNIGSAPPVVENQAPASDNQQVFIIEEGSPSDLTSKRSDVAVWNSQTGQYELVNSQLSGFPSTQIIEILEADSQDAGGSGDGKFSSSFPMLDDSNHFTVDQDMMTELTRDFNKTSSGDLMASASSTTASVLPCQIKRESVPSEITFHQDLMDWSQMLQDGASVINVSSDGNNHTTLEVEVQGLNDEGHLDLGPCTKIIQLETDTGDVIHLPRHGDQQAVIKNKENQIELDEEAQGSFSMDLPFGCNLCKKRFSRKLHLNNHMERHHGIKFVFTEKGRKVKLIRIPEGFKIIEGEKLDPCVEKLIKTIDKDKLHSIIGVEEIEPEEDQEHPKSATNTEQEDREESRHFSDLLHGNTKGVFGCGFLFREITFEAYQVAISKGETPFAAFFPPGVEDKCYLFCVMEAGDKHHLLFPATKKDARKALNTKKEAGESGMIPIVAALRMKTEPECLNKMFLEPIQGGQIPKLEILSYEEFLMFAKQCEPTMLRSLASSLARSPSKLPPSLTFEVQQAPRARKKFQRRVIRPVGKENKPPPPDALCTSTDISTPVRQPMAKKGRCKDIPKTKLQHLRRNLQKEFDEIEDEDDDEEKDASYHPTKPTVGRGGGGRRRGRGRPPGTKNRPRKISHRMSLPPSRLATPIKDNQSDNA